MEEALIQIHDPELRKLLNPTTADLRFADYLVRHVTENRDDVFLDGTGWEGGDEWIRAQFAVYIHALLAATLQLGKNHSAGAGEMAQWLKAPTALLKVLSSNPSNHMVAHNHW